MGAFAAALGNAGKAFLSEAGSQIGTGIGGVLGYGIGEIFGHNKRARRQQLEQQNKLNALAFEWNKRQMNYAQELEKQMYQFTFDMNKPEALKNLYKEAGLNPALMYGTSASGVSGTSVGGAKSGSYSSQAANESEIIQSKMAIMEMGLQLEKIKSDIKVNESVADLNKSSAELNKAKTKTEDEQRAAFIAKLYYDGKLSWFETLIQEIKFNTPAEDGEIEIKAKIVNDDLIIYGGVAMPENIKKSLFGKEIITALKASDALANNHIANTALTNEQLKYYYTELMAELAVQQSQAAVNLAKKLESEWETGEYTNWKNILESAVSAVNALFTLFPSPAKMGSLPKGVAKGVAKQAPKKKTVIKYDY